MLEKFSSGLFTVISNMLMKTRGKGVCGEAGQGCGKPGVLLGRIGKT